MDKLIQALKEQGFTLDEAIEHLKKYKELNDEKEKGKKNDALSEEKLKRLIDSIVEERTKALETAAKKKETKYEDADDDEVKEIKNDIWLLGHVLQKHPRELDAEKIKIGFATHAHKNVKLASIKKALDTVDHSDIVPTEMARQFIERVENASVILSNLRVINLPSNPYEMPYQSASVTAYGVDEATEDSAPAVKASDTGVANITFHAKKIGARALWSRELDEDSAIAILPMIREDFIRVMRESWERAFIFGDESTTGNINSHDDDSKVITTAGQKSFWLQADGLVHHCIVVNTGQAKDINAALSAKDYLNVRKLMGKYGDNPDDVIYIVNRKTMYDTLVLDEVLTLDKLGNKATILTGQIAAIHGSPILVSDGLPETDDNGKISATAANNDNGAILAVNRRVGAIIGRRGEMRIAVDTINKTDQYEGVVFSRYDIQMPHVEAVAYGYNIT